jgi:hypothetical protein
VSGVNMPSKHTGHFSILENTPLNDINRNKLTSSSHSVVSRKLHVVPDGSGLKGACGFIRLKPQPDGDYIYLTSMSISTRISSAVI